MADDDQQIDQDKVRDACFVKQTRQSLFRHLKEGLRSGSIDQLSPEFFRHSEELRELDRIANERMVEANPRLQALFDAIIQTGEEADRRSGRQLTTEESLKIPSVRAAVQAYLNGLRQAYRNDCGLETPPGLDPNSDTAPNPNPEMNPPPLVGQVGRSVQTVAAQTLKGPARPRPAPPSA